MVVHPAGGSAARSSISARSRPEGSTRRFSADRGDLDRALHLASRQGRPQHAWAARLRGPRAVRGYARAVERFGRMQWRDSYAGAPPWRRKGCPVDWYMTLKIATTAGELRLYDESRRIYLPGGLPPAAPPNSNPPSLAQGRLAETLARLAEEGPEDLYTGEIAAAIAADVKAAGGVLAAEDLANCRPRIVPALDLPYRGYTFQAARGLSAAPTLADVLDRLEARASATGPTPITSRLSSRRCSRPMRGGSKGWATSKPPAELHDAHHRGRPRRRGRRADHDAAVELRQPLCAAADRHPDENGIMWFDPRPGAGRTRSAPGKRALTNMCPLSSRATAAALWRWRVGRAAHSRRGAADGEFCRRFRHEPGRGGASAADRCERPGRLAIDRRLPETVIDRHSGQAARRSSSTRSGRSNSPARTSCCGARTASITASPTRCRRGQRR